MAGLVALGGCDLMASFTGGQAAENGAAGNATEVAANNSTAPGDARTATDAGITSSRSLAGLSGGEGGKDPLATPAGASPIGTVAPVDPQLLLGRWADDDACKTQVTLRPDGTFVSYTGGGGTWALDGDRLSLTGDGGTFSVRIRSISGDTMTVINSDGSIGRSRRC